MPPLSQAHESPLLRVQFRLPNGELHRLTMHSTHRLERQPDLSADDYQRQLTGSLAAMLEPCGGRIITIERVNSLAWEVA